MNKISTNSFFLFVIFLALSFGCRACKNNSPGERDVIRGSERDVIRGRLKFIKGVADTYVGGKRILRGVKPAFYVNGEEWSPDGEPNLAAHLYSCDTSPNPKVEILRCHNAEAIYILRMKNDKPELQKIPEFSLVFPVLDEFKGSSDASVNNIWINDEGRWLLFHKFYLNVETGEKIEIKKISPNDGKESFVEPYKVIGVSPDMKIIVEKYDNSIYSEKTDSFVKLQITDIETGKVENRKVSWTKNPWLTDFKKSDNDIQSPPAPSKHFDWEKGADGKDKIVAPELSERLMPVADAEIKVQNSLIFGRFYSDSPLCETEKFVN